MLALTLILAAAPVEVTGYLEARQHLVLGLDADLADLPLDFDALGFHPDRRHGAMERLRPTLKLHGEDAHVVFTPEAVAWHGFFDRPQTEVGDVVTVERAYATVTRDAWDHTFGKQLVTWGSGLLANPTDPFAERSPLDLRAERPGVWALKSLYALDDASNLVLVAAADGADCCAPVAIARFDRTVERTDLAVQAVYDDRTDLRSFGLDVKSELEVGLWLEGAWHLPAAGAGDAFFSVESGVDYSFDVFDQLYLAVEHLYQGDGLADAGAPEARLDPAARGRRSVLGRHAAIGLARVVFDPAWQLQALTVTNLGDGSGLVVPQLTWLPGETWELVAGAQITYGPAGGEFTAEVPDAFHGLPVPPEVRGARLVPTASLFAWGRHAF